MLGLVYRSHPSRDLVCLVRDFVLGDVGHIQESDIGPILDHDLNQDLILDPGAEIARDIDHTYQSLACETAISTECP